jgi:hypothetical protein
MPLKNTWDWINNSIKKSTKKTPLDMRRAAEKTFAGVILRWMEDKSGKWQIRLNGISDNLIHSLKNDKNKFSLHLERYHTKAQARFRGNKSFKWDINRRYSRLFLAAIGGPNTLVRSVRLEGQRRGNWFENISSPDIESSFVESYDAQKRTGKLLLNIPSLFKTPIDLRYLARWWMDERCFENKNYDKNRPYVVGIEKPETPRRIEPKMFHFVPAANDINGNAKSLSAMELLQQKHDEISEQSNDGLDLEEKQIQNMRSLKRAFTGKFRPWLAERINNYWFRVMVVEKENHGARVSLSRKYVTSSYEKLTLCLIIVAWFRSANKFQSSSMGLNLNLHSKFVEKFPLSECHFKTAEDYVAEVKDRIKISSEKDTTIKDTCSDCGSRSITRDETRGEAVCDDCFLVIEEGIPTSDSSIEKEWGDMKNMSEWHKPPGKPRKKDWEMKIFKEKDWVFSNSDIDEPSKKIIEKEISKFIEAIRRYKNKKSDTVD